MKAGNKKLTKKEQKEIVSDINTGAIPKSMGFPGRMQGVKRTEIWKAEDQNTYQIHE